MPANPASDIIDLRAVVKKLLHRWWWFGITCGLAGALGVAYLKVTPKTYLVEARMLMGEGDRSGFGKKEDFLKGMSLVRGSSQLEDDIAIMTSRTNILKTLRRLDFSVTYYERSNFMTKERYDYPPFKVHLDSVAVQITGIPIFVSVDKQAGTYTVSAEGENVRLYNLQQQELMDEFLPSYRINQTARIGEPFVGDHLSFRIDFPEDRTYSTRSEYFFHIVSLEQQLMNYGSRLQVEVPDNKGHIVRLSMTGHAPNKEIAFINKLMETFIEGALYKQQQKGRKTISFIDDLIGSASDSLRRAEQRLEQERVGSGTLDPLGNSSLLFQERSKLEDERGRIESRVMYCGSMLQRLRASDDIRNFPPPTGFDEPALNSLIIDISRLNAEIDAESVNAGVRNSPAFIAKQRKRKNLLGQLEQLAESVLERSQSDLARTRARISEISYSLGQKPKAERIISQADRELDLRGGVYTYLMEKKAEAGIAIASDEVDKSIVDDARVVGSAAVGPSKKTVLGGAIFIGLLIPVLIILVRDFFNDRISSIEELKRATPLAVLAVIPASKRKRVLPNEPKSLLAESFRTARINLQYLNANVPRQVIGFTSGTSGEGKTFCAVNLATVLALSGKKVLLLDADMRRPNVVKAMDLPDGPGLSTWLIGEATVGDIVKPSDVPGLDVIGAGPIPPNPGELAESQRMGELLTLMRGQYDHIIIDASPIGLVSEFVVLMGHLDVTLYVVRERLTRRSALRAINELTALGKLGRVDILFNDMKADKADGYGYYTK